MTLLHFEIHLERDGPRQRIADGRAILHPAAPVRPEAGDIVKLATWRKIPEGQRPAFCDRAQEITVVSYRQFLTTVSLANYVFNGVLVPVEALLLSRPSLSNAVEESLTRLLFSSREKRVLHTPARFEHYILQAVTDGNTAKLKPALLSPQSGSAGRMSSDPIQQEKYTFVCFVTLVTRAAIAGGLSSEIGYYLR